MSLLLSNSNETTCILITKFEKQQTFSAVCTIALAGASNHFLNSISVTVEKTARRSTYDYTRSTFNFPLLNLLREALAAPSPKPAIMLQPCVSKHAQC